MSYEIAEDFDSFAEWQAAAKKKGYKVEPKRINGNAYHQAKKKDGEVVGFYYETEQFTNCCLRK